MSQSSPPPLIPWPRQIASSDEICPLATPVTIIAPSDPDARALAERLGRELAIRCEWPVSTGAPTRIVLRLEAQAPSLTNEGYRLVVRRDAVEIAAGAPAGLFYGFQTLRQVIEHAQAMAAAAGAPPVLPGLVIEDRPRFAWRGLHLDVARHFFPVACVKDAIDWCASLKLNRFHWHLTDDQGWRLPVPSLPRLTEIGAWRSEADGSRYGGCYTEDEIREVVAYAAERFVTVVPEIDLPGHARAAAAAYPELSCRGEALPVPSTWGVFDDILCAGSDEVLRFVEIVLGEVARLFPGPFVHIGGDEAPATRWLDCPRCRARLAQAAPARGDARPADGGQGPAAALQAWFTRRMCEIARRLDRTPVGWDEIVEGGLAPGTALVMAWRSIAHGVEAARAGHPVIMCPMEHCYLDSYQGPRETEPPAFPRDVPLASACAFDPVPPDLSPEVASRILGGQANIWTEYMPTWDQVTYMAFPRLHAIAEALWSERARPE